MEILEIDPINIQISGEKKIINGKFNVSEGEVVLLTGPNGCGKSTIIKIIMGDIFNYSTLQYNFTNITFHQKGVKYNILSKEKYMEIFRKNVCYVSQEDEFESNSILDCFLMSLNYYNIEKKEKYIFDFVRKFGIYKTFQFDTLNRKITFRERLLLHKLGFKKNLTDEEKKVVGFLSMNIKNMSGGQKKLANIVTNLIKYEFCNMIILDEPLNNLDYNNVRTFSNLLTRIYQQKPEIGILLVTHCRSIPIVNKVIEIEPEKKCLKQVNGYVCNSCFGSINKEGLYV